MTNHRTINSKFNRTGARVASPSSGVRPGARALNLELPTSFGLRLFMGALCLLLGGLFLSHSAYAASYLNVSSSGAVSLGSIRPTSSGTSSTGSDTLTVHTDCSTGYSVYVSGQNGKDTNLTNGSASSDNIISTSSNAIGSAGSLNSNTWGLNYENTGAYVGLPTYSDSTNKALTSKSDVGESSPVPIYYGIKVDTSITPGTYTGDVLYTVLMDSSCLAYTVVFDSNGGSGTMDNQSIMAGTKTELDENSFTRDGYTFLGWSTKKTGKTETAVDGVGTEADVDYSDKAEVTDLTSGGSSITLYAIWGEEVESMQSWKGCPSLSVGESVTLEDIRDNRKYAVKKLPDGKCWMVQNLRLVGERTLTPADSDVSSDFVLTTSTINPATASWCKSNDSTCYDESQVYYNSSEVSDSSKSSYYGAIYNWYAATAGTGTYSLSSGDAISSICPKGWRLPIGGSSGEFAALDKAWGGTGSGRDNANTYDSFTEAYADGSNGGFGLAGYISGSLYNIGSQGFYWSSTAQAYENAYYLELYLTYRSVYPGDSNSKGAGRSVRCLWDDYDTMQAFDASAFSGTVGDSTELKDTRDGKIYTVKRLPDGKVWMMQNLTIGMDGAKTLTPADTNIDNGTTYYLPPAGKQGSSTIDDSSTLTATTTANFDTSNDNHAKTQFRTKNSSVTNSSDTGYYNFYTVTLGFSYYNDGIASSSSTRDICPRGWRLPWTSNEGVIKYGSADFYGLALSYNGDSSVWNNYLSPTGTSPSSPYTNDEAVHMGLHAQDAYPLASTQKNDYAGFSYGGYYSGTTLNTGSTAGRYWTASIYSAIGGYSLYFASNEVSPYGNNYKYYGVAARCIAQNGYTVNYSSDGATSGEPEKTTEGKVYENSSITLPSAGTMIKDGYAFKGWALTSGAADLAYTAGETVALSALLSAASSAGQSTTPGSTLTFYPVWKQVTYMQSWTGCSALSTGESVTLTDSRDNRDYAIKKLPDGKCWMVQNLALGMDATEVGLTLTPADTNIDNGTTYYLPPAGKQGSSTIDQASTLSATDAADFRTGSSADKHAKTQFRAKDSSIMNDSDTGYYNFYTATLGFSYYQDGVASGSSARDICPKGWRLPKVSASATTASGSRDFTGDFAVLASLYNPDATWLGQVTGQRYTSDDTIKNKMYLNAASPLWTSAENDAAGFSYSGSLNVSNPSGSIGSSGHYWVSSVYSTDYGYNLTFSSSNNSLYVQYYAYKANGNPVRCVVRDAMQENTAGSLPEGETTTLRDARDNQTYTVYRWPSTGIAGTDYPIGMAGYAIMTQDLSLGYVTGVSITKGSDLILTTSTSAASGTIVARASTSDWSAANSNDNKQYINGPQFGEEEYSSHSYYSFGAALAVCPRGWLPFTDIQRASIISFMGSDESGAVKIMGEPFNFTLGGHFARVGSWEAVGNEGYYWSSTQDSPIYGRGLYFYRSDLSVSIPYKYYGMSVRCVAAP